MINRNSINDWNNYLSTLIIPDEGPSKGHTYQSARDNDIHTTPKFGFIQTIDVFKECENTDEALLHCNQELLKLFSNIKKSDLTTSFSIEYTDEKNARHFDPKCIVISWVMKCTKEHERPLIEAGSPLNTLINEYGLLSLRQEVKRIRKTVQRHNVASHLVYHKLKRGEIQEERMSKFFNLLSIDEYGEMNDTYCALKKMIPDPKHSNVIHFLSPEHLTFVFRSDESNIEMYEKYVRNQFGKVNYFVDEDKSTGYVHYDKGTHKWKCNEAYHVCDNYYAISIENNVHKRGSWQIHSGDSVMILNNFIENFNDFDFNWYDYPGNLYIGNVCKIIS